MDEILLFQHDAVEDLGLFIDVFRKERAGFRPIRMFQGEMPPEEWEHVCALIFLGGFMTAREEEIYPFLRWEKKIIRAAIENDVSILGIGLGAQLIASALGGEVYRGNVKEVGWYPISINAHGQVDSLLGHLPEKPVVFGWHEDSFALPSGCVRLASSMYFENQAFRFGKNIYGLQFHLDATPEMIDHRLDAHAKELAKIPYVSPDKVRADTRSYSSALRYYGERLLSEFIRRSHRFMPRKCEEYQAKL